MHPYLASRATLVESSASDSLVWQSPRLGIDLGAIACLNRIVNRPIATPDLFTYSYAANAPLCQIVNFRSTSAGLVACFQSPKQEVPYCPVLNENANSNNWLYLSYMDSFPDLTANKLQQESCYPIYSHDEGSIVWKSGCSYRIKVILLLISRVALTTCLTDLIE